MKVALCRGARAGFTLIELVLSAALMAMILSAAYLCLRAGVSSQKMIESREEIFQSARVALARLSADLRAACSLSKEIEFVGMDRRLGDIEADNLDFGTRNISPKRAGESDFAEVSYFLGKDRESNEIILWRRVDMSPDPEPLAGGTREEMARGLSGLRFEYYDGFEWYDEWGDPDGRKAGSLIERWNLTGLPEAVRITLWFSAGKPVREGLDVEKEKGEAEAPFEFETVVRLNLAALSQTGDSSGGSNASRGSAGGTPSGSAGRVTGGP